MKAKQTVSFSKNATNVFFHILTACNLNCRHCYINPAQHGSETLPLGTIEKWLECFASDQCGQSGDMGEANVIFLGGEPTLHPELAPAIKKARALGYQSVTVDTNGYLFHDILDRVTPAEVDYFSFSLDGATPETNDRIRGQGVYEICLAGLEKAKKKGFGISLIYTVSRENLHELPRMVPLVKKLGIDRFFIQVIGIRGRSAADQGDDLEGEPLQLTREEWLSSVPKVAEAVAESGIIVSYPKVFLEKDEPFECAGLCAQNFFIFPNGRVYRCPLCEDFPLHALEFQEDVLLPRPRLNETDFFKLNIPEGCVMNKLIQPDNLRYNTAGEPEYRIACCMLKAEIALSGSR